MKHVYNEILLGDMKAVYVQDEETGSMELVLLPEDACYEPAYKEKPYPDSMIQVKLVGDAYQGAYAGGRTLRESASVEALSFDSQQVEQQGEKTQVRTVFRDERGYIYRHILTWQDKNQSLFSHTVFENHSTQEAELELLSSFSIGGISPFVSSEEWGQIRVHRIRSVWSMEGRPESQLLEELQLEPSWGGHAVRSERFGQVGSMPVNGYFPYAVIEDTKSDIFWGVQLMHNASWQMELYRRGDDLNISGGLADYDFGHWKKKVAPGEQFTTPTAILSVCRGGGIDKISQRMTAAIEAAVDAGPASEQELPVMFNEYCTTWGCPSHENICAIVDKIREKGFSYFVIDCGWYKQEGVPWDVAMGDYRISQELFPEGLQKTVDYIKESGMKPGIWFEIDNVGAKADSYNDTEHLLKREGTVLTTSMRRFWDMRQKWVQEDLAKKVIGTLNTYGFEYMKMDYNDSIGVGCDGAESLGEGLRQNMEASLDFIRRVKREVPGIILENCASGGHKLEPLMMSECSMASFSDAHECEEIPIIAANLHRVILPRQSQIWAVIRKTDSLKRIAYSIVNTFLGRMCLSGDVTELSDAQWQLIDRGIAFYRKAAPVIKHGYSMRFGPEVVSYRHPTGWQCLLRLGTGEAEHLAMAVFHTFNGDHAQPMEIPLPADRHFQIADIYSDAEAEVTVTDGRLICAIPEDMRAVAVLLEEIKYCC
ncbi:MAG: glycoside hydrolase family 36 protein [Lachnospiraceae bacterium]